MSSRVRGTKIRCIITCFLFLPLLGLGLGACSLGALFGGSEDDEVLSTPTYRTLNAACSGLNLSEPPRTPPAFRKFVGCLNSNGAFEPFFQMVNGLSDEALAPLVELGNEFFLSDPRVFYDYSVSFRQLDQAGLLDPLLESLGAVIENREFFTSAISLFQETVLKESFEGIRSSPEPNTLKAFEILGEHLDPPLVETAFDVALSFLGAESVQSLERKLSDHEISDSETETILRESLLYLKEPRDRFRVSIGSEWVDMVANGAWFRAVNDPRILGTGTSLSRNLREVSAILDEVTSGARPVMDAVSSLHWVLREPISCCRGAQSIERVMDKVYRELSGLNSGDEVSEFIFRTVVMDTVFTSNICERASGGVAEFYPSILSLAETELIDRVVAIISVFNRISLRGGSTLASLLIRFLSDTGPTNESGFKRLIPLMSFLSRLDAWGDLLAVLTLPRVEDSGSIEAFFRFLNQEQDSAEGWSLFQLLFSPVLRADLPTVHSFVRASFNFLGQEDPILFPLIELFRKAFHINDVHPVVESLRKLLSRATQDRTLYGTIYTLSRMPEFPQSLELISDMARDGRLKKFFLEAFDLLARFSQKGSHPVAMNSEIPPFRAKLRHRLSSDQIGGFEFPRKDVTAYEACREVDLGLELSDFFFIENERQLGALARCLDLRESYPDLLEVVTDLRDWQLSDGRGLMVHVIELMGSLYSIFGEEELRSFTTNWLHAWEDGRYRRFLEAVPFWVRGPDSVVSPLLEALPVIMRERGAWERILQRLAAFLIHGNALAYLETGKEMWDRVESQQIRDHKQAQSTASAELRLWVEKLECERGEAEKSRRAFEIESAYQKTVNTWQNPDDPESRQISFGRLETGLRALIDRSADPRLNDPATGILDRGVELLGRRSGEELATWLWERSIDDRPVLYFYPGEDEPRVRLVNSLDRLELLAINANHNFLPEGNFALQYMQILANAWGDLPREHWPLEIQGRYSGGDRPPTLREAFDDILEKVEGIEKWVGHPELPDCVLDGVSAIEGFDYESPETRWGWIPVDVPEQVMGFQKAFFNARQVLPVIAENLPGSDSNLEGGATFLRDLFFALLYSSPRRYRTEYRSEENNLSVLLALSEMGFLRILGSMAREMDASGEREIWHDAVVAVVDLVQRMDLSDSDDGLETFLTVLEGYGRASQLSRTEVAPRGSIPWIRAREKEDWAKRLPVYLLALVKRSGADPVWISKFGLGEIWSSMTPEGVEAIFEMSWISKLLKSFLGDPESDPEADFRSYVYENWFGEEPLSDLLRVVHSIVADDVTLSRVLDFATRARSVLGDPEYQALEVDEILHQALQFILENRPVAWFLASWLDPRLSMSEVGVLRTPGVYYLWEFLELGASDPHRFSRLLESLGFAIETGDLMGFYERAERFLR